MTHHDALEFPDGVVVLVSRLREGQRATVLQLPAAARPQAAKERETPEVPRAFAFVLMACIGHIRAYGEHRCA